MDTQAIINGAIALAGFFGGWIIKSLTDSVHRIEDRLNEIPFTYVAKEDYKNDIRRVHDLLDKIWCRIDEKADK